MNDREQLRERLGEVCCTAPYREEDTLWLDQSDEEYYKHIGDVVLAEIKAAGYSIVETARAERLIAGAHWAASELGGQSAYVRARLQPGDLDPLEVGG